MTFAYFAHLGQNRNGGEPYIIHPIRVVEKLKKAGIKDEDILAAAYLHDTIEDCPGITVEEITKFFNTRVASLVLELTNIIEGRELEHKYTFEQKQASLIEHCKKMSNDAKLVKICDRIDNIEDSILIWKPEKVKRYALAGLEILEAMKPFPDTKEFKILSCELKNLVENYMGFVESYSNLIES